MKTEKRFHLFQAVSLGFRINSALVQAGCTLVSRYGERLKMRGLELRDVTTVAGRAALTQILLVGVAHLTYACQRTAAEPP